MRERIVFEEFAVRVGHDEFVGGLAVCDRKAVILVVLNQADDLEIVLLPVRRLDVQGIAKLDLSFDLGVAVLCVDCLPPDSRELLVQVASDVGVVFS